MIDSNETIMYENGISLGYEEGYNDGLSVNVGIYSPKEGDLVALFYDLDNTNIDVLYEAIDNLWNNMPNYNIIALPKEVSLKKYDKYFLKNYIESLQKTIEEME